MKVIIAGSRTFNDYKLLTKMLFPSIDSITQVVCGGARGADALGKRWAEDNNKSVQMFYADWDAYGKGAGYRRNEKMGNYADILVAFWDGESRGTKHMIDYMRKLKKPVYIYNYITEEAITYEQV